LKSRVELEDFSGKTAKALNKISMQKYS